MKSRSPAKPTARLRRWMVACACLLIVLVPIQGVALVVNQYLKPAHYHLSTWSTAALGAAVTPASDDVVLETLAPAASARAETLPTSMGYHPHAPGDPGVVYVDDDESRSKGASLAKLSVDSVTMQLPDWPLLLPTRERDVGIAMTAVASPIWRTSPPERPPTRSVSSARAA